MRIRAGIAAIASFALLALGAAPAGGAGAPHVCSAWERPGPSAHLPDRAIARRIDDCMRLNQIQVLGTHNSYHVQPAPGVATLLAAVEPELALTLEYTHPPLTEQLAGIGIRQLELDVFADPAGGLYADPVGMRLVPSDPPFDPEGALLEPGFKVFHVQDIDFRSRCLRLVLCLTEIRAWSDANPGHLPVMILIEAKDEAIPDPGLGFVVPIPIGPAELDALDAEIRSVFDPSRLITPDDVRGGHATLREAVETDGWPTLGASRGKVMFALDNGGTIRDAYLAGRPTLEGRVMFTDSAPSSPAAAFVKLNDPIGSFAEIQALVAAGFVVRTRADADTVQARTGDTTMRDAALASGAQWVSTDYPVPGPFETDYVVTLPGGPPARCNPVETWGLCRAGLLEPAF